MKLIDKDALLAEIDNLLDKCKYHEEYDCAYRDGNNGALYALKGKLDTLEVKEVDYDKEATEYLNNFENANIGHRLSLRRCAQHFFELGLSVSNSTKVTTPDIDDVLKENGVNPYSKEAKIIKESYFMAIEKLTQKGE